MSRIERLLNRFSLGERVVMPSFIGLITCIEIKEGHPVVTVTESDDSSNCALRRGGQKRTTISGEANVQALITRMMRDDHDVI